MKNKLILVAGAGGFIGGHLVARLRDEGVRRIRCVDIEPFDSWYQLFDDVENVQADLRLREACQDACHGASEVYNLAAHAEATTSSENQNALSMLSVLINTHLLQAANEAEVDRYFYSSSASVYNADKQDSDAVAPLKEADAYSAMPRNASGWEKLFSERMCRHFREDYALATRVARIHEVYGPHDTWDGGREKTPAAICRKVIEAKESGAKAIELPGNAHQTRSFLYIDDCIEGILKIAHSDIEEPLNLGAEEPTTLGDLVEVVEEIAGVRFEHKYEVSHPAGANDRSSDNTLIQRHLSWAPGIRLREGLEKTYNWIYEEFQKVARGEAV